MRLASAAQSSHVVVKLNTETKTSRRLYTTGPCLHITSEVFFFNLFTRRARGEARGDDAVVSRPQPPERASSIFVNHIGAASSPASTAASSLEEEKTEGRWEQS